MKSVGYLKAILLAIVLAYVAYLCRCAYLIINSGSTKRIAVMICSVAVYCALSYFYYKPIRRLFSFGKRSDAFFCAIASVTLCGFETHGLATIFFSIKDKTASLTEFWYIYIIILILMCFYWLYIHRKPLYTIEKLDDADGYEFEQACADILKYNGFKSIELTPGSSDFGVDILAEKDGERYAVQCKCYSKKLDNSAIQEVIGGLAYYECTQGAVMTNSYFTEPAKKLAEVNDIQLWDRDVLSEMAQKTGHQKN